VKKGPKIWGRQDDFNENFNITGFFFFHFCDVAEVAIVHRQLSQI
jgi:hypothetical protein